MIRFDQRRKLLFLRSSAQLPVLIGDLESDFHRGCAGVRIKDTRQAGGSDLDQFFGEENRWDIGQAEHRRVGNLTELLGDSAIQVWVGVAVDVTPQRRDPVQVTVAVYVDEVAALALGDDNRIFGEPLLHLGERVPEVGVIPSFEVVIRRNHERMPVSFPAWAKASSAADSWARV